MMDWLINNWRDAILIVVGGLGIYVVLSILRLVQLGRSGAHGFDLTAAQQAHDTEPGGGEPAAAEPAPAPAGDAFFSRLGRWTQHQAGAPVSHAEAIAAAEQAERQAQHAFADELRRSNTEKEVHQLRRESALLRAELADLHEEMALLKASRNVAPMYSEAAALAQRGVSADGIAGQCGISLGEAELVAALARAETRSEPHLKPTQP